MLPNQLKSKSLTLKTTQIWDNYHDLFWVFPLHVAATCWCCAFHQNVARSETNTIETLAKRSHHNMRTQQQMKAGQVQLWMSLHSALVQQTNHSSPHHFSRLCWVQTSSHIDHCLLSTHNTEPITSHVHIFTLPAVLVCFCICMTHFHPTYFYLEESLFLYNLCKAPECTGRKEWRDVESYGGVSSRHTRKLLQLSYTLS